MAETTTIFLDLEETIIESWWMPDWLHRKVEVIAEIVQTLKRRDTVLQLGLMSWAVGNDSEKVEFNTKFRTLIEDAIDLKFSDDLILSIDDWIQLVMLNAGLRLSREDVRDLASKEVVLFWLRNAKHCFPTGDIILIDDAVDHDDCIISHVHDRKIVIKNIDTLVKMCKIDGINITELI